MMNPPSTCTILPPSAFHDLVSRVRSATSLLARRLDLDRCLSQSSLWSVRCRKGILESTPETRFIVFWYASCLENLLRIPTYNSLISFFLRRTRRQCVRGRQTSQPCTDKRNTRERKVVKGARTCAVMSAARGSVLMGIRPLFSSAEGSVAALDSGSHCSERSWSLTFSFSSRT